MYYRDVDNRVNSCHLQRKFEGVRESPHLTFRERITLAKKLDTIWKIDPHTQSKHAILRRYWEAWLPIMGKYNQRILYIDGFAGPGRYEGGEDGSPLIALISARDHQARPNSEVVFTFIEKDKKRFEHLGQVIEQIKPTLPKNFKVHCVHGVFDNEMAEALDRLEEQKDSWLPAWFLLIRSASLIPRFAQCNGLCRIRNAKFLSLSCTRKLIASWDIRTIPGRTTSSLEPRIGGGYWKAAILTSGAG